MTTTQARKRVRAKPEDRRAQIIDEAVRLIGERGYYGFGIRELAQRCQLTDAGLLHYFGAKDRLLIAVLEESDRRNAEFVQSAAHVVRQGDAEPILTLAQVREVFHATVVRNSRQPELVRLFTILHAEALNKGHPAYDYFLNRDTRTLDAFSRTLAPHVDDPRAAARLALAAMRGLEQDWLRFPDEVDLVAEWERAAERLLPKP